MWNNFNDFMNCCGVVVDGLPQLVSSRIIYSTELNLSLEICPQPRPTNVDFKFQRVRKKKLRQNDEEKVERNLLFLEHATAPSGGTHFVSAINRVSVWSEQIFHLKSNKMIVRF